MHDLSNVLIDGAVPRSNYERCKQLLDAASHYLIGEYPAQLFVRLGQLRRETDINAKQEFPHPPLVHPNNEYEYWHETENDIIELISDALPAGWYCTLAENDPGTVIVTEYPKEE
mgnify:CR=1 FL=1